MWATLVRSRARSLPTIERRGRSGFNGARLIPSKEAVRHFGVTLFEKCGDALARVGFERVRRHHVFRVRVRRAVIEIDLCVKCRLADPHDGAARRRDLPRERERLGVQALGRQRRG